MGHGGRPWWEVRTRTARQAYALVGFTLLAGAFNLALVPASDGLVKWLHLASGLLLILVGVACLASARLRRNAPVASIESLVSLLDAEGKAEIDSLLARRKGVLAVRRARELTGLDLVDAKRVVDSLRR